MDPIEAVGWLGVPVTIMLFISPIEVCFKIYKAKEVGGFSPVPYYATLVNSTIWIMYALIKGHMWQVILVNGIAWCSAVLCLAVFIKFSLTRVDIVMKMIAASGACIAAYVLSVALSAHVSQLWTLGVIGTFTSNIMFAGPLAVAAEVIKTESVKFLPLMPSVFAFAATFLWSSYAILKGDVFVFLANGPGFLLAALQLTLYWKYSKGSTSKLDEVRCDGLDEQDGCLVA
jgi:uncharacterized protein with PQ loop repeat